MMTTSRSTNSTPGAAPKKLSPNIGGAAGFVRSRRGGALSESADSAAPVARTRPDHRRRRRRRAALLLRPTTHRSHPSVGPIGTATAHTAARGPSAILESRILEVMRASRRGRRLPPIFLPRSPPRPRAFVLAAPARIGAPGRASSPRFPVRARSGTMNQATRAGSRSALLETQPFAFTRFDPGDQIVAGFNLLPAVDHFPDQVGLRHLAASCPTGKTNRALLVQFHGNGRHRNTAVLLCGLRCQGPGRSGFRGEGAAAPAESIAT